MQHNATISVTVDDRPVFVTMLGGRPWYVQVSVRLPNGRGEGAAALRTIWHRDTGREAAGLARSAIGKVEA